ncbi:RNA polymerase sigma factor, sigma-70 family [Anaerosporobacter mobilis DSM 15930]|jgi:RNA polymerase primary sigma factor|uniref:RNA polymerase sigma factor, sigma-70 family n=1 Tax=Anaerosporobacter mobilis DSM 15930 TaxID=1120996 RepID=A0A1M7GZS3_9FIRM|nr:sigma-70 domain-containing protein [Anaerosporobacter mobilis]SHM21618.1 RNA polymerase sigma factor, sigma-70 family [Anaerosporobacter mobilis DSM 15930]
MQDKENFLAMLAAIVDLAKAQDNIITMDEIKELLDDSAFTAEQMGHVYEYLAANQIRIQGYIRNIKANDEDVNITSIDNATESDNEQEYLDEESKKALHELKEREERFEKEEASYIKMYLEDLEAICPKVDGEMNMLINSLRKGNRSAKERLLELHLREVVDIARSYRGKGLFVGDLIQEGNIGLMTALEEICTGANRVPTESIPDTLEYIVNRIRESMEFVIHEQQDDKILENRIVEKINFISSCVKDLAEEFGREATLDELVEFTKLEKSEIADIMELAKDALSVSNDEEEK